MPGLSPDRWRLLSPYLDRALAMTVDGRVVWLASLHGEDPALADEVAALLDERSSLSREGFLQGAAVLPGTAPPSLAGQRFGAYTLLSPIGQGGMGSVWLADRSDGRFEGLAAVKLLNASLVGRAGEERFKREGNILARLAHPNIARLADAGVSPAGQPYLVLEHVQGEPIDRYCDARNLEIEARLRLFLDVLSAVAHAHANLIVHRDIKPSNVLVDTDGAVKLLDFGIAKLLEEEAGTGEATALTREGGSVLTPEFAAPEQVTCGAITTATDVYALGTLLYMLLTGKHPAGAAFFSPADLVKAIVDTEPRRLSDAAVDTNSSTSEALTKNAAIRSTTPEGLRRILKGDLDTIIAKALKKNPEERYPSVTAFAGDVRRYLNDEPISARPDTLAYRVAKFVQRHRAGVAATATVILLLAALMGFYTVRLAKERDRARLEAQKATRVSELLTGLLTGADPYEAHDVKEPTVRALLDAGAERIERELAGEPGVQAEMLTVIGQIYERLGLHDKAQPILEKAVTTGRRAFGPENEHVATSLNNLGVSLREKGDSTASAPILEQALAIRRKVLGNEHKDVAVTLVELADVYTDQGFDEKAEPLFRESLTIRRKVLPPEDPHLGASLNDLALLLRRKGDLAGAESMFREALEIFRRARGETHPFVASLLGNLALVVADRRDFRTAESLFREQLAIERKTLGQQHPSIGNTFINLSRPLLEQGKYDEAASAADEGLCITRASLGNDHPRLAYGEIYMAKACIARNQPAVAEPLLRDALRIRQRTLPPDDWRIGVAKSVMGDALTRLERYEEAEAFLLDAQRVLKDVPGAQGQEAEATRTRLGALYRAWGRPERAAENRTTPLER
jgi:serine/threonine protein kinase/Flp pilus assembly protein TadD